MASKTQSNTMECNLPSFFILFPITLFSLILYKTLTLNRRLRLPPSPFALPIIGHLHLLPPIPHQSFHALSQRHGPLIHLRLGSVTCIVTSSPAIAREILKTQETSFINRPQLIAASYLTYGSNDFAFGPYGPYWRFMRRISMHELLSAKTLDHLSPVRHEEMLKMVEGLYEKSKLGVRVDVGQELMKFTNNAISRVALGRRCSGSEREAEEARRIVEETTELVGKFNLADYIGLFRHFDVQGIDKRVRDLHRRYDRMMELIIKEKEEKRREEKLRGGDHESGKVKDLLDILLDVAEDESAEVRLTKDHIKAFILDVFTGGSDTSAITTEWGLAELINHPAALEKARAELDAVVGTGRVVRESDIPSLPYLQSVVKETLRLHPTGPLIVRKSTQHCKIAGYDIPPNTHVFVNAWSLGRDPDHWDHPLDFRPERFMGVDGGGAVVDVKGQHFQLLPFGSGRRGCPGAPLAMQVIQLAMAAMVQCFEWRVEGEESGVVDMSEGVGLTLPKAKPLVCTPVPRLNPMPAA